MDAAQVFIEEHNLIGESILWDDCNQKIIYTDVGRALLFVVDPATKAVITHQLDDNIGVIGFIKGDEQHLIAAAKRGPALIELETGKMTYLARFYPPEEEDGKRSNDGCIDKKGRLWSGTMNEIGGGFGPDGYLFRFDPDGTLHRVLEGLGCPNGMNFSLDSKTFYVIDSFLGNIIAYDYDLEKGTIRNERVLIDIPSLYGVPDGAHIASDGTLWTAMSGKKNNVIVIDPGDRSAGAGKIIKEVEVPTGYLTDCSFGGKDLKDLYISTGGHTVLGPTIQQTDPHWGYLYHTRADTAGTLRNKFVWKGTPRPYQELKPAPHKILDLGQASAPVLRTESDAR